MFPLNFNKVHFTSFDSLIYNSVCLSKIKEIISTKDQLRLESYLNELNYDIINNAKFKVFGTFLNE
ncbi:hypothetical protein HK099_004347 [Clydaea vesicula]|uniref:Uncharacterized protein n=1 Tax=Clydaea vesicula TaxID=447962 RepID=A0AAD5XVQ1_9FUNG|nr:hypothetical protein HK099_004347 [Clydaea vesicula]